jgi:hypothetical protein
MKKNELRALEALAATLRVRVDDLLRLKNNPAARVTVSAPGGFHIQSALSEVMDRHVEAATATPPPKAVPVPAPKIEPAAPKADEPQGEAASA